MNAASGSRMPAPEPAAVAELRPDFLRRRLRLDADAPAVDNIARVIGAGRAASLIAAFGGTRLYIPARTSADDPIARLIGYVPALRLGAVFGGERVCLPNAAGHTSRLKIALLRKRGMSISRIARELGCSERYVYKVLAKLRDE